MELTLVTQKKRKESISPRASVGL